MRCLKSNLLVPVMVLVACVVALAQGTTYKLGRTPSEEEIRALGITINPDGKGLPPGSGTAKEGAKIFAQKCMLCHGPIGPDGPARMRGDTPEAYRYLPFATTIWDHINRTMPQNAPGSLSADEVYALTAYLLYLPGIVKESDVIDAKSLPKIQMPNRNGFTPADPAEWKPGIRVSPHVGKR